MDNRRYQANNQSWKGKKLIKYYDIPREVPTRIAVGVARPNAHGQDTT